MTFLKGVIRGKTIELDTEPGLPDGQAVTVLVKKQLPCGEGIRRSAGSWADAGGQLDDWLADVRADRARDRSEPAM